jgi:uncharacterized protein
MSDEGTLERLVEELRRRVPGLVAIYAFGSRARQDANVESDFDLAVLAESPLEAVERWNIQEALAVTARCQVDLVDLLRASTVMRVQVLKDSKLLFDANRARRELFEATALGAYARLNDERRGILQDLAATGRVHG